MEGPLEVGLRLSYSQRITNLIYDFSQSQQEQYKEIQTRIPTFTEALSDVASVEAECEAANVEENDYTVFTYPDLAFELELVIHSIAKKFTFIENQVSRS